MIFAEKHIRILNLMSIANEQAVTLFVLLSHKMFHGQVQIVEKNSGFIRVFLSHNQTALV